MRSEVHRKSPCVQRAYLGFVLMAISNESLEFEILNEVYE